MASVSFDQATRVYPGAERPAVDALDLEVGDGEFLVLVGPSGCGKSTSLRMLAGLEDVNAGAIRIGERDVTHLPPKDRDIAMVFQNYALYPHMTVADNMGFALKIAGVTTVYVTHDQVEAMTMGDRVAVLKDGILQQVDSPRNMYDRPANLFVAGFIGSPAMNLIEVPITDGGVEFGNTVVNVARDAV